MSTEYQSPYTFESRMSKKNNITRVQIGKLNEDESIPIDHVIGKDLVLHHIESYDAFLSDTINTIIESRNPLKIVKDIDGYGKLVIETCIKTPVNISKPTIFPTDARTRSWSYTSDISCSVEIVYHEQKTGSKYTQVVENVRLCRLPVMIRSSICRLTNQDVNSTNTMGECPFDYGGYFIIDGQEKVFVAQERATPNRLISTTSIDKGIISAKIACRESGFSSVATIELRCRKEGGPIRVYMPAFVPERYSVKDDNDGSGIPLCTLMRAIGVSSDQQIIQSIFGMNENDSSSLNGIDQNVMRLWIEPSLKEGVRLGGYTRASATAYLFTKLRNKPAYSIGSTTAAIIQATAAVIDALGKGFLPHITGNDDHNIWPERILATGRFVRDFLEIVKAPADSDIPVRYERDNFMNKRILTTGPLFAEAFFDLYNEFIREVSSRMDAQFEYRHRRIYTFPPKLIDDENRSDIFNFDIMSTGFSNILKGVRGLTRIIDKQGYTIRESLGVVQELSRVSYLGFMSHMRRVAIPVMTETQLKTRSIHTLKPNRYGFICPCESPDGIMIGILNNLAINSYVTHRNSYPTNEIIQAEINNVAKKFKSLICDQEKQDDGIKNTIVYINDISIGTISSNLDYRNVAEHLRSLRRNVISSKIFSTISVVEDGGFRDSLWIYTDAGRCLRKLVWLDPKDGSPGGIELIGVEEVNSCSFIAKDRGSIIPGRHTHCELHPGSEIFSVYTATVPFVNHNHAPYVVFSGAQGKQAVGMYATTFAKRMDTHAAILNYPQRALVSTRTATDIGLDTMCSGQNAIVAIACRTGFNEEDAVIVNRASIDRGLFTSTHFHTHYQKIDNDMAMRNGNNNQVKFFANPLDVIPPPPITQIPESAGIKKIAAGKKAYEKRIQLWKKRYHALVGPRGDGTPKLNAYVRPGDAIIGVCSFAVAGNADEGRAQGIGLDKMTLKQQNVDEGKFADNSQYIDGPADTGYIDAVQTVNSNSGIKVRIRQFRRPTLGDKLASRHGQKGVVGNIMDPDDMPYTDDDDGLVPDIIVSPFAYSKRMTMGQLLEGVVGAEAVRTGILADATGFDATILSKELDDLISKHPERIVIDGVSGRRMPVRIFVLPIFYQRLKHMVIDKVHSRRSGPRLNITGQPTGGRAMNGGLRLGEMERDAILGSGSVTFLKEAYVDKSDKMDIMMDADSKSIACKPPGDDVTENRRVIASMPRAMKALIQEIEVLNIQTEMSLKD